VVGRGEVALDGEVRFERFVVVELGAVVEGDRLDPSPVPGHEVFDRLGRLGHVPGGKLPDDGVAAGSLHQREHAVAHVAAHHGVALPVPDCLSTLDLFGALADVALARQHPAGVGPAVTLASELGHDPQVPVQHPSTGSVLAQVLVDGLHADRQFAALLEHAGDLFRTPVFLEQAVHLGIVARAEARHPSALAQPGPGVAVRLLGAVRAVVPRLVALDFASNGRRVPIKLACDCAQARAYPHVRSNEVSFLSGELAVRFHVCNLLLAGIRLLSVSPTPLLLGAGIALTSGIHDA